MAEKNILNYENTKNKYKDKISTNNFIKKIKKKNYQCNILYCKNCNDYWKPYKKKPENLNNDINHKKIKFRKDFRCHNNCQNCKKYILKKNNNGRNTWL